MSRQGFQETLVVAQVAGAATNAAAATSLLPPAALYTFPTNYFSEAGKMLRITATGVITSNTTGVTALQIVPQFSPAGGAFVNVAFSANSLALVAGGVTQPWTLNIFITCRAIGNNSVGSFIGIGNFTAGTATANTVQPLPIGAPAAIATFDTTVTQQLDLKYLFGVASASESIQLHQYILESLN